MDLKQSNLLSQATASKTKSSIDALFDASHTTKDDYRHEAHDEVPETLGDFVYEILEPKLESWLNKNLPSLVERIVKEEIQNITRGK
jgi:cell pole-organizing protein PopZ